MSDPTAPDPAPAKPPVHAGTRELPITVIMNSGSGSRDNEASQTAIQEVLRASGRETSLLVARHPSEIAVLAQRAADRDGGILAAAGGDGTLNAVATVARAHELPFGLVPLGTFNYFARQLGIPLDPAGAARILVDGVVRSVAVGDVNGHLFLNNASIGLYRRLIERRELDKRQFGRNRFVALLSGIAFLLREHRPYRLRVEIDDRHVTWTTLTVFFGRNELQMEQLGLDEAQCIARGELAVLAPRGSTRRELLGLAFRGALARLESAASLRQHCAREVRVERIGGRSRRLRVAIDGESVECDLPLVVRSIVGGLKVLVPSSAGMSG